MIDALIDLSRTLFTLYLIYAVTAAGAIMTNRIMFFVGVGILAVTPLLPMPYNLCLAILAFGTIGGLLL